MQSLEEIKPVLATNFPVYAECCLRIRTKRGTVQPFVMNRSQEYVHGLAEKQMQRLGRVRAIILKGRQMGSSTYVEGRLFHRTTFRTGVRTFILTHEAEATKNLFEMAERFYENLPQFIKPQLGAASAKELEFPGLDSGYRVGTAGNKAVGRSQTIQCFHGSEVAFWPNAEEHALGILQTIGDENGTEIWLESTANGRGNFFHGEWKKAEAGQTDFIPIFIPWFWDEGYIAEWDDNWTLTEAERYYFKNIGIDLPHLAWRRKKIAEMETSGRRGEDSFKQEYPATAEEAFDTAQGKAYEKLNRQVHQVRNFIPPIHFTKFMVIDWGTAKPFAVGWFCVVDEDMTLKAKDGWKERFIPKNSLILYREWYGWNGRADEGCRMESFEVAKRILEIEKEAGEKIDFRIGDSAMWNTVDGPSIQDRMFEATNGKFIMCKSRKDRIQNYQEFRARINGSEGVPQFYATEQCKHFWRTVPELLLDELHPEKGVDTKQEDHIHDCVMYACAEQPVALTERDRHEHRVQRYLDGYNPDDEDDDEED